MFDSEVKGIFPRLVEKLDKFMQKEISAGDLVSEFGLPIVMDLPIQIKVNNEVTKKGKVVTKIDVIASDIPTEYISQLKELGFVCKKLEFKQESEQERVK